VKTGPKPVGEMIRFLASFIPEPNSGCWLWERTLSPGGYGQIRPDGQRQQIGAHRFSYEKFKGPIPDGMMALHRCDVRCCVNPDHLFVGTHKDNTADMFAKGRSYDRKGEGNNRAKLTAEQVLAIRSDDRDAHRIAADYGVQRGAIYAIKSRHYWSHI
jgi:hypothetical protein